MATDPERELLASHILNAAGKQATRLPAGKITGFLAMAGQAYDGGLMVVGRSVNGWDDDGILPSQLSTAADIDQYADLVQQSVAESNGCPMRWVIDRWHPNDSGYRTSRSAFWRCIRHVVHKLGITDVEDPYWSSHLVWSNIYKLSHAAGGQPGKRLRDIQLDGCKELFKQELRTYRPTRVLLITGIEQAAPFLQDCKLQEIRGSQFVQGIGLDHQGTQYVVAVPPQGRPEQEWVSEVLKAFGR